MVCKRNHNHIRPTHTTLFVQIVGLGTRKGLDVTVFGLHLGPRMLDTATVRDFFDLSALDASRFHIQEFVHKRNQVIGGDTVWHARLINIGVHLVMQVVIWVRRFHFGRRPFTFVRHVGKIKTIRVPLAHFFTRKL